MNKKHLGSAIWKSKCLKRLKCEPYCAGHYKRRPTNAKQRRERIREAKRIDWLNKILPPLA